MFCGEPADSHPTTVKQDREKGADRICESHLSDCSWLDDVAFITGLQTPDNNTWFLLQTSGVTVAAETTQLIKVALP